MQGNSSPGNAALCRSPRSLARRGRPRRSQHELPFQGLPRDEDAPSEHPFLLLNVCALRERGHPVVQVLIRDSLGRHLLAVVVDLRQHVAEIPLEVMAPVPPRHVHEPGVFQELIVHRRSPHERRRVAIGEPFQRLLVRAVRAHDVREHEDAAGLEASDELLEQRHLVAGVAQDLAAPHRVERVRPLLRERIVDVPDLRVDEVVDGELLAARHVERVLPGAEVVPGDFATESLRHRVAAAAVAGPEV
eukprot:31387-Pelagococcus_subviridis.AAC.11